MSSITVVVPTLGGPRLARVLASLAEQSADHQVIVVDDGSPEGIEAAAADGVEVLRMETNSGFSRAVNAAAERAEGEALVLLNDDCVVDPDFLERITAALDPAGGVGMVASVMRDWAEPALIDSAGMELDRTLLVWDYLNGEPLELLDRGVADPVGPSAAAAAFDRAAFRDAGGFDQALFAYWEDVDLVLRLRRRGFRCALAADARGTHEHSASFKSGSARKNYLTGFGRGYVLGKWGVLSPRRLPAVIARDAVVCAGQALIDRNLSGVRGRIEGYRAANRTETYPEDLPLGQAPGAIDTLSRRLARRKRLRARGFESETAIDSIAFFHLAETSGPSRSLERELEWVAGLGELTVVVPGPGDVADLFGEFAEVRVDDYSALTRSGGLSSLAGDVRRFRALIRERGAGLVVVVTAMLPAALIAARRERVPAVIYSGELFEQRGMGRGQLLARRALKQLTGRLADGIATGSRTVAAQFDGFRRPYVEAVYPPVGDEYAGGDGPAFRRAIAVPDWAPLVVAAGSISEGRGQDLLVRAVATARGRIPELRCVIAGAPFDRAADLAFADRLSALIDELGLRDAVTLAGQVEDIPGLLAAADVVVNPARFDEPFGRVPFEAAVAGAPAIVTRVGAADELFTDGESALVVEPDDPDAMASAIVRLLEDGELAARLVTGAQAFARERLTPEASLAGWQRVVRAALVRKVQDGRAGARRS
jgi:GT2 family glycosyltransferase/glycosyltransferase involved in cell wall biosynthesis